jgi:glycosyltransferase involved in cell wall biosynthesis
MIPKIAVVLSYFPTAAQPNRGTQFLQQMTAMSELCDLNVFVVQPEYPKSRMLQPRRFLSRRSGQLPGLSFSVTHIDYPAVPVISRAFNGRTCAGQLLPHIRAASPDAILAYHIYPEADAAVRVARRLGVPAIAGAVGSDICDLPGPLVRLMTRRTLAAASLVLTKSNHLRSQVLEFGVPPSKVRAILNGCDEATFRPQDRAAARSKLGVAGDTQLVAFTGNLVPVKGLSYLIEAAANLIASGRRITVVLIGNGPLEPALRSLCSRRNIPGNVLFAGSCAPARVAEWLAASDVFCLPSLSEGYPNVVLEALSCGRPVVASAVGGVPELLDASCGILVPPRSPALLADALKAALDRHWDHAAIAGRFRRSWADMARETVDACVEVIRAARTLPVAAAAGARE